MRRFVPVLAGLLLTAAALAGNPLAALLGNLDGLAGAEERLLHRKAAGPYTVTVDGQRLVGDAWLRLDVRQDGVPLGPDATLTLEVVPPAGSGLPARDYTAVHDADRGVFVVDPLGLDDAPGLDQAYWDVAIRVDGPAGNGETSMSLYVYPPKLEPGPLFGIVSVALPLAVLALFGAVFAVRRTALLRTG